MMFKPVGTTCLLLCVAVLSVSAHGGPALHSGGNFLLRHSPASLISTRTVGLVDRTDCGVNDTAPTNRVDTSVRVSDLIAEMDKMNYTAYIIPSGDAHQSEYPAAADERRAYISGFSGSAGTAVVLSNGSRALWTDGRYFLEADQQLDCKWFLMKSGQAGVPTILEFLQQNLAAYDVVAADATLMGYSDWIEFMDGLKESNISMVESDGNLVDIVWEKNDTRPPYPTDPAFIHPIEYAGKNVTTKLAEIRAVLAEQNAEALFVTALDDVAWLYNIRGKDIAYNPVVRSYALVTMDTSTLFIEPSKVANATMMEHLNESQVTVKGYEAALMELKNLSNTGVAIMLPDSSLTDGCSYEVYNTVASAQRIMAIPPTLTMKAMKNPTELGKMEEALKNDGAAVVQFMAYLEAQIRGGATNWTELTAQNLLTTYREKMPDYVMLSFEAISGYGPNGAVIHYGATEETDTPLGTDSLYVLDSGGQYLGATTDVTRTFHFGTPDEDMIEMYTRVLMGTIDFGSLKFPYGTTNKEIDVLARRPIYERYLDYRHGTSHGIGMMMNVHEPKPGKYEIGHCMSDEPGYYKDGFWGIRIENQMYVKDTNEMFDDPFYTFEHITMVPMEPNLINVTLLSGQQLEWLNEYHGKVYAAISPLIQENQQAIDWLTAKTAPLQKITDCLEKSGAQASAVSVASMVIAVVMSIIAA